MNKYYVTIVLFLFALYFLHSAQVCRTSSDKCTDEDEKTRLRFVASTHALLGLLLLGFIVYVWYTIHKHGRYTFRLDLFK